jgi:SAM-dependent methyltransferase
MKRRNRRERRSLGAHSMALVKRRPSAAPVPGRKLSAGGDARGAGHVRVCEVSRPGLDTSVPNVARMYDYMLGGRENFQADRDAAERILRLMPGVREMVLDNRAFLRRAVRYLAEQGISQFLDIGTGLPSQENVHEVAHRTNPEAKVAYVDRDPIVVSHGKALLAKSRHVIVVNADLCEPEALLRRVDGHLDFTRPVAVLLLHVLNFVADDDDPARIIACLREALCPGSYLAIAHVTGDGVPGDIEARARATYDQANDRLWPRAKDRVLGFFDGFGLVEPGLTPVHEWRADEGACCGREVSVAWVGVGRKPSPTLTDCRDRRAPVACATL